MKNNILFLIALLGCTYAHAQTASVPIKTDRPDQTESPSTVPPRYWQVEAGALFESDYSRAITNQNFLLPTTLTKYGVSKNLELRLIREVGISQQEIGNRRFSNAGFRPLIIGMKVNLFQENRDKFIPKTSFIGHLGLQQFASDVFEPYRAFPLFRFLMEHTLTEKVSLGYNLGMEWNGFSANPSSIYTLSLARDMGTNFGAFAELYGYFTRYDMPNEIQGNHRFDGGVTYLLNHDFQFDISADVGLTL